MIQGSCLFSSDFYEVPLSLKCCMLFELVNFFHKAVTYVILQVMSVSLPVGKLNLNCKGDDAVSEDLIV